MKTEEDRQRNKEIAVILLDLFRILDDRKITTEEGIELCKACVKILHKIRDRVPKLWQRICIDTACNVLLEVSQYLDNLERHARDI